VTHNRLNDQDAGIPPREFYGASVDQSFKNLLEASSLGTPAARSIRSSTASDVVDDVRRRMELRRELPLRETAAAHRRRAADLRRDEAVLRAEIAAETARGSRKHQRLPRWIRQLPKLVLAFDYCLLLYFFAGITDVDWTSPLSVNLAFAVLLAAVVTTLSYGFLAVAGHRLRGYKDHSGAIVTGNFDGLTRTACGTAAAGMVVIAALIFIRMRALVLDAFGPQARPVALVIALALAAVSLLPNILVVAVAALDGSADTTRPAGLTIRARQDKASGPPVRRLRLRAQAAAERAAVKRITVAGAALVAADQVGDGGRALRQSAGPLSEPAANPNGQDSSIGYNRTADRTAADKHGPRPARRPRPRRGSSKLTDAIALAAVAVMAIAVAVAATVFGLRFSVASQPGASIVIAATATANEPAPTLPADILQTLRSAADSNAAAAADMVSSSNGQPTVLPLTPRRGDGQITYGPDRAAALDANISAVERALQNEGAAGPLDLLTVIAAAARDVSAPGTLIVVSSGLDTAGGFDLLQVGWDTSPSSVAAHLKAEKLLPDLAGWHVIFSGLGDVAGRQPALPQPQQTTLAAYWTAICQASGAASCSVDKTPRPQLASHVTSPAPVVPVPAVTSVHGSTFDSVLTTLPDTLLFQPGSTTLNSYADKILQPIVQQARSQHLLVSITGYTSPDGGSNAYNLTLSAQRAHVVSERLIALGLPVKQITQVTGAGTAGKGPDACMVHGQLNEACAQLRRVVVVLSPADANP
jgi:outer membrane protein OmpA-like peptidoglycan-associated protein